MAEVEWLLDGGVHPLMVCQTLGRKAKSIYMAAKRAGNGRVAREFARYEMSERTAA